jgi:uncharacterized protein YjbJ (UPF0337 family)
MEWNAIQGSWTHVAATMKQKWNALTDDDLQYVDKNKEAMVAKVRARTGLESNTVERQLDTLIANLATGPVLAAAPAAVSASDKAAEPLRTPPSGAK